MSRIREHAERTTDKVKHAFGQAETKVLAAEGRRSIKRKAEVVRKVTRKALKTGAIAGALVAVAVVAREVKKRRALE